MRKLTSFASSAPMPVKSWAQRLGFMLLLSAAGALMLVDKADTTLVERIRTAVTDSVTPLLDAVSEPVGTVVDVVEQIREFADLRGENAALRQENERLRSWQAVAQRLEAENLSLREQTRMAPDPSLRYLTARVIGDPGGAFARSVLINAGRRDGVAKGQAAITGVGLAGRVVAVGVRSARILLLSDINSRIPVQVGTARERAILSGDNSSQPKLLYFSADARITPGDQILTSGHGGAFPPGIPVGEVAVAGEDGIQVQPFVDLARIEYLRIANYERVGVLLPMAGSGQQEAAEKGPQR